eukprot:scaffold113_cov339-Pavlova_lutheri.AAC.28
MAKGGTCASVWEKRVWDALDAQLHRDAVFLAERMAAETPGPRSAHALARAHYARGELASARHALLGELGSEPNPHHATKTRTQKEEQPTKTDFVRTQAS